MDLREGFKLVLEQEQGALPSSTPARCPTGPKIGKPHRHEHLKTKVLPRLRDAGLSGEELFQAAWVIVKRDYDLTEFGEGEVRALCKWFEGKSSAAQAAGRNVAKPIVAPTGISFYELQRKQLPPPSWVVKGLIIAGLIILAGPPKTRKSWWAMCLSLAVAYGELFLGHFTCKSGDVLHLALEDNERRFQSRLNMLCGDRPAPDNAYFYSRWPRLDDVGVDLIHKWLDEHPATRLLVIDTFGRARPPSKSRNSNSYQADYDEIAGLQTLALQREIAMLMIHHSTKAKTEDVMDEISGTYGLSGAADTLMVLKSESRENVDATLHITGRDVDSTSLALRFERDSGSWSYVGVAGEVMLSKQRRDVRDALLAAPGPLGIADLASAVGQNYRNVQKTLERLVKDGHVSRATRGRYQITDANLATWGEL